MDGDPYLALEVAVAAHYRLPHSGFLAWDKDDRDKAVAQYIRTRETCGHCGTRQEQWDDDRHAFVAKVRRCRGCEEIQKRQASLDTQRDGKGLQVYLEPRNQ